MSNHESDQGNMFDSIGDYLKDPNYFEATHHEESSIFKRIGRLETIRMAGADLYFTKDVRRTREYIIDFAKRWGATDQEAIELLHEIGLADIDQETRIQLLRKAAQDFIDAKTPVEALEKAMDMYPPTPELLIKVIDKKVQENESSEPKLSGSNLDLPQTDVVYSPPVLPPAGFFRKLLRRDQKDQK